MPVLPHRVRDMRDAEHLPTCRPCKRIECRGFHLDGQHAFRARCLDCVCGLAKRCISRPARTRDDLLIAFLQSRLGGRDQGRIWVAVLRCWGVVVANTFVAKCAVNDDEVRRLAGRYDLAGRGDANQKPALIGVVVADVIFTCR